MKPELRYQVITVFRIVRRAGKANKTVRRGHGLPFERPLLTAKVNIFGTHPEKNVSDGSFALIRCDLHSCE